MPALTERFIPAGAGNTYHLYLMQKILAVYPRWRGEHIENRDGRALSRGLSPLARGTPAP